MPEGPSIVILKEEAKAAGFEGRKVLSVGGNTKEDVDRMRGKVLREIRSWGKHLLLCFSGFTVRIHLMLFGSYRINETKESAPRLSLTFTNGEIHFYACSVKFLKGDIDTQYNWSEDVMNDAWDAAAAAQKVAVATQLVCDTLLEQDFFSGVGNIIKNEVLYRIRVHPESISGSLPPEKIKELIEEARIYAFQFLEWKKKNELKKHWLAHTKKRCLRCDLPMHKKVTGAKKRRSFFCTNCQILYV